MAVHSAFSASTRPLKHTVVLEAPFPPCGKTLASRTVGFDSVPSLATETLALLTEIEKSQVLYSKSAYCVYSIVHTYDSKKK